ncbi:MAG: hypothetical protein ABUL72_02690, partial [Armatimonadota bacterium]
MPAGDGSESNPLLQKEDGPELEPLTWTVDLSQELRPKRLVVVIAMLGAALIGIVALRSVLLALVGVIAVFASAVEVFLPLKFRLDKEGGHRKVGLSSSLIAWKDVKRVVEDEVGIHLSPFAEPNRLDAF